MPQAAGVSHPRNPGGPRTNGGFGATGRSPMDLLLSALSDLAKIEMNLCCPRTCAPPQIGEWCNGSTADSGSACLGSNPSSPASYLTKSCVKTGQATCVS